MEKEFVPYELALRMKALGFDEPCLKWFIWRDKGDYQCVSDFYDFPIDEDGGISAPTWQSAYAWFNKVYRYDSTPSYGNLDSESLSFYLEILIQQAEKHK